MERPTGGRGGRAGQTSQSSHLGMFPGARDRMASLLVGTSGKPTGSGLTCTLVVGAGTLP